MLPQAAKKYALAAGYAALHAHDQRVRDLAPAAIFDAARYEHQSGAWLSALAMTRVAILLQSNYAPDPWNLDRHETLGATILQAAAVKAACRCRPALAEPVSQLIACAALTKEVDEALAMDHSFLEWDEAAFRSHSEKELTAPRSATRRRSASSHSACLASNGASSARTNPPWSPPQRNSAPQRRSFLPSSTAGDPVLLHSAVEVEVELSGAAAQPSRPGSAAPWQHMCALERRAFPQSPARLRTT